MNYSKSLTYMFNDPKWVTKILLAVVVLCVPILNLAFIGYAIALMRKTAKGWDDLPEWDELGEKFFDGIKVYLAEVIYTLPVTLCVLVISVMAIFPFLASHNNSDKVAIWWVLFGLAAVINLSFTALYSLVFVIFRPALLVQYSKKGTFGSFFHFKEIFGIIRNQPSNYFLTVLMTYGIGLIGSVAIMLANTVLGFIPFLGWALTIPVSLACTAWSNLACYQLYGQIQANLPEAA